MSIRHDIANALLEKHIPELAASKYGMYPMSESEWLSVPTGTNPDGGPCVITGPYDGLKTDYVFGSGPQGQIYYHLMAQQSYVILYKRMKTAAPTTTDTPCSCFSSKEVRKEAKEHAVVTRILRIRANSSTPNDLEKSKDESDDDDIMDRIEELGDQLLSY